MRFSFLGRFFGGLKRSGVQTRTVSPAKLAVDFRTLTEGSLDMICVAEVSGHSHHFVYASPATFETIGWTVEEFLHLDPKRFWTKESMSTIAGDIDKLSKGEHTSMVVVEAVRKNGRHIWLENKVRVLQQRKDGTMSVMVCMRDVTERKYLEEQLEHQALIDGLTGINNRRAFDQAMDREWRRAVRSGLPLSLVLVDVDHFKLFNDAYGHQVGDDCLRFVAEAMRAAIKRAGDVVARYGGEEFAALLPDTEIEGAGQLANRLCEAVADLEIPHRLNRQGGGHVTISCGVASAVVHSGGTPCLPKDLILSADAALYTAKHEGRNRVASSPLLAIPKLARDAKDAEPDTEMQERLESR